MKLLEILSPAVQLNVYLEHLEGIAYDIRKNSTLTLEDEEPWTMALNYTPGLQREYLADEYGASLDDANLYTRFAQQLGKRIKELIASCDPSFQEQFFQNTKLVEDMRAVGVPLTRE